MGLIGLDWALLGFIGLDWALELKVGKWGHGIFKDKGALFTKLKGVKTRLIRSYWSVGACFFDLKGLKETENSKIPTVKSGSMR